MNIDELFESFVSRFNKDDSYNIGAVIPTEN